MVDLIVITLTKQIPTPLSAGIPTIAKIVIYSSLLQKVSMYVALLDGLSPLRSEM
jgi:hypothetical protein